MINFNRSQRLGLDIDRHIALDAGAGTGKTTVMASRYLQHLLSGDQRATRILPSAPRIPLQGMGAIRCPSRERTSLTDWPGLLPTETVAITFTRKAAAELKGRIRRLIASLRAQPTGEGDIDGIHDTRLRNQGDVAMLLSLVDDAPISTIDSFLSSIVSPWLGLVCEDPTSEQVDEDGAIFLREEAIRTAWRLQRGIDGIEAGMSGDIESFLSARDRLSVLLGGQSSSSTVVRGMLKRSLFVEEASRSLNAGDLENITASTLDNLFIDPINEFIDEWYSEFRSYVILWVDAWLDGGAQFVTGADVAQGMTRYRYVQYLCTLEANSQLERLQWVWLVSHAVTTFANLKDINCKSLHHSRPPKGKNWPSGIATKGECPLNGAVKDMITGNASEHANSIKGMLHTSRGLLVRILGQSSHLLNPLFDDPAPVPGQTAYPPRLDIDLPQLPPGDSMRLTTGLELQVIQDLFTVHRGVQEILSRLKVQDGVRDHDDMHRLAEDLLLTKCPAVCRSWYPISVIDALDSMGEQPWLDDHLHRAIDASQGNEEVHADLMRRVDILRELRRQYRAFIIDEYQDTNPQHFRLLARLWGRRKLSEGEPSPPASQWDPTICIVGDMKQSIYRFRQAEVTVMRRAVAAIREMNRDEAAMESRTENLRRPDAARDPRPIPGAPGESTTFVRSSELLSEDADRNEWVSFHLDDNDETIDNQLLNRRREGHIEMSTNHRTLPRLMNTMNSIFQDSFADRHHILPGPWHAESQDLAPARSSEANAKLEWILPARTGNGTRPIDPEIAIDPFLYEGSKDRELAANLLAKRISALINGGPAQIYSAESESWLDATEDSGIYRAEDIMILVSSHGRVPQLLAALDRHGVPAMAGKQGVLLHRPVIQPLMSLLWLLTSPNDKSAALAVARSTLVGMNDSELIQHLSSHDGNQLRGLISSAPTQEIGTLISRLDDLSSKGKIRDAIETAIDYSDLLYSYPREGDRQDVENWLSLYDRIASRVGGDAALVYRRLTELSELDDKDAPKSSSPGSAGAVQILSIHGSKGLEAPVVVAYDVFATGTRDTTFSSSDNVLVTPNIVAGRIHPWRGSEKPLSGLWTLANLFDDGQQRAERRRQFYVALTRARDRLIIAGTSSGGASINADGTIKMKRGKGRQNMGQMFLDGLAHASMVAGNEGCSWSQGGINQTGATLVLDPGQLHQNAYLNDDCVQGISIFHHPDCFESNTQISTLNIWRERLELSQNPTSDPVISISKRIAFNVPMTSHGLDVTHACNRRHWLSGKLNWNSERFEFIGLNKDENYWPAATEFGSLFHRLLEIGLANPGSNAGDLDVNWTQKQLDNLTNEKTLNEVMAQSSITDEEVSNRTRLRLLHLGKLARNGALGKLVLGEEYDGFTVEGLRTELPFYLSLTHHPESLHRTIWTPKGRQVKSVIESINAIFDGRADLVLALRDNNSQGWLQVVDAKTKQCLGGFNPSDPLDGNDLQMTISETSPHAASPSEEAIVAEHRLQLTLYSLALEIGEAMKPESERRKILPPAIQISASGRLVRMTDDDYKKARLDLDELVRWIGETEALGEELSPPNRLPVVQSRTCESCPYYSGSIKLCGPEGERLGPA
jgi:ATP-dependent exoDNAse (exonuclease V) beta subunit